MDLPPLASLRSAVSPLRGSARRLTLSQDHQRLADGARRARGGDSSLRGRGALATGGHALRVSRLLARRRALVTDNR
jgi:hypothetical protein